MFIVFEGIDGSGKGAQIELLYNHLNKNGNCLVTEEPTDGPIGIVIRRMIERGVKLDLKSLQIIFAADRAHHVTTMLNNALNAKINVISDRYIPSTIAYGMAGGIAKEWLEDLNSTFPKPDIVFIMDVDPEIAITRIGMRTAMLIHKTITSQSNMSEKLLKETNMFEKKEFLTKVRENYMRLAKENNNYFIINGNRDSLEISKEIINIIEKRV